MSKQTKRKITVEAPTNKNKDSARRPSVFERLGTKATSASGANVTTGENLCRHWIQNGNCPYGKICKYANTHTLISPSKRAAKKETDVKQKQGHTGKAASKDDLNKRLHSTVVVKKTHSPDLNWENWDQTDLEYEDEKVLEKRRQLLQRELELQMKREKEEQQRQKKDKKSKKHSSSSSTSASSSSSTESSSSSDDSSSTSSSSTTETRRRKGKSKKSKRESSSSVSETDRALKKKGRSRKGSVKGESPTSASKKSASSARRDDQRLPSSTKRCETSPHRKAAASKAVTPSSSARKRSLTPPGRSGSGHRRRTPSPSHSNTSKSKLSSSRSNAANKQSDGKHVPSRPNRSLSLDRKDKHNRSTSPRNQPRDRDRDRDRDKDKDKDKEREREREKEKERERDKDREKDKEREREREKDRDKEKDRDRDRGRSRSPKRKGKSHSPRRNSRPPKDPRKRDSPELGKDKSYRTSSPGKTRGSGGGSSGGARVRDGSLDSKRLGNKSSPNRNWSKTTDSRKEHDHGRSKDDERKKDDRRSDVIDRVVSISKDRGSRETTLERSGSRGGCKDDGGLSRDGGRKRDSQMLPGIVEKTAQDRDFLPKSRDHGDGDRDRDRDRSRDARDLRDPRDIRDPRDPRDRDSRDAIGKDPRDNLDPRLTRDRGARDLPSRNKDREDGLDRGHDRSRDRKDLPVKGSRGDYDRSELPSLLSLMTHPVDTRGGGGIKVGEFHSNPKGIDKGSDRGDRGMDRDRGLDRDRVSDRDRGPDRDRGLMRGSDRDRDRDRGSDRDRGLDRGPDRDRGGLDRGSDRDRGLDRGLGRGHDRNMLRGSDRGMDRGSDRGLDRNQDRGLDRGSERNLDRGSERSFDRGVDRVPSDRVFDRTSDRNLDRVPPHMERERDVRDNHSDRDYPVRGRDPDPRRQPIPPDDKGYDSPYDSRRARDDRGRYVDQMDRGRYDDGAPPRDDPRGMVDRRMGVDPRNFPPEDRRGRREGRNSLEPIRSRDPWDGRDRDPRERDRDRDPREIHERDRDPRDADRRRGGVYDESRPPGPSIKGRDWDTRDYSDSRREWDGRGGRRGPPPDWEGRHSEWDEKDVNLPLPHSMAPIEEDWNCFPGPPGDWPPGDRRGGWSEEWEDHLGPPIGLGGPGGRPLPRLLPMRGDDSMMIITREVKMEGSPREDRRILLDDPSLDDLDMKDDKLSLEAAVKMDEPLSKKIDGPDGILHGKRARDLCDDIDKPDLKKFCMDDTPLEEDLSDISDDDADEILNREDSVEELATMDKDLSKEVRSSPLFQRLTEDRSEMPVSLLSIRISPGLERESDGIHEERIVTVALSTPDASRDGIDSRSVITSCLEDRQGDDEAMDNLDFEEISDEELEEDSKAGIGDALGVDWASLMAATRPKEPPESKPGSARRRWRLEPLLLRIGFSVNFAGYAAENLVTKLKKFKAKEELEETGSLETTTSTTANGTSGVEKEPAPNPVAGLQVAIREKAARRRGLFSFAGPYKRALSARRDIDVRRELCNLSNVESTEGPPSNADNYLYRLSVQLFDRSG